MITATLRINVCEERRADVNKLLRSLIEPTRVETGCLNCRLYYEKDNPNSLTWVEEWKTEGDLRRHVGSPQYRRILAALDMSDVQPEVRFDKVVETTGMQLIAEARKVKPSD
jgi:quinol monooxygenase YgiN